MKTNICIYFRVCAEEEFGSLQSEYVSCQESFVTVKQRTDLVSYPDCDNIVICRYSALPFYEELERDFHKVGFVPINTYSQHQFIANMSWYSIISDLTFQTWFDSFDVPDCPIVIKGATNSRKGQWNTKMFAPDKRAALDIMAELWQDPLVGPQGLVFREYVPLKTFEIGINGLPMTNEWRCFFYKNSLIAYGFYWSNLDDMSVVSEEAFCNSGGLDLAINAANRVSPFVPFFVIDVAQGADGRWWVVEVNDAQMSGLSTISPSSFYKKLWEEVVEK